MRMQKAAHVSEEPRACAIFICRFYIFLCAWAYINRNLPLSAYITKAVIYPLTAPVPRFKMTAKLFSVRYRLLLLTALFFYKLVLIRDIADKGYRLFNGKLATDTHCHGHRGVALFNRFVTMVKFLILVLLGLKREITL